MAGKKWGGSIGIGNQYDGLLQNINKECGVDLPIIRSLGEIGYPSEDNTNYGCKSIIDLGGYDWLPDIFSYTQRSLSGNNSV